MVKKEQKPKFKTGDRVRFKKSAPDALFPPFDRNKTYVVQDIHGGSMKGDKNVLNAALKPKKGSDAYGVGLDHLTKAKKK